MKSLLKLTIPMAIGLSLFTGCGLLDGHVKQMDILNGMSAQASKSLAEGAITSVHASGQGLNPGITVEAAIVYRATAKYDGLAGQFCISQSGVSRELTADERAMVESIYRDAAIRAQAVRELYSPSVNSKP